MNTGSGTLIPLHPNRVKIIIKIVWVNLSTVGLEGFNESVVSLVISICKFLDSE